MRRIVSILLLAVAPVCIAKSEYPGTRTKSWPFAQGGRVELLLGNGDVHIVPAKDPSRISIRYSTESYRDSFADDVKPAFNVKSSHADLEFDEPNDGSIEVELEVPVKTNVYVRAKAGDLSISGIEGDTDVETEVGNVHLLLLPGMRFYEVDVSTHTGNIDNCPVGEVKGRLAKAVSYRGDGAYRLHAHTRIGDIRFREVSGSN